MYLKSIKAYGFKSFADKIDIEINHGITGIVGPNGSGKSNIVDAVKWVLGEQSVKNLRGNSSMTDVIFNGSKSRDAMTRAYVSLTFDNSDHYLQSDFAEIEIKRVLYKTGENEYYLNNVKVRLKDILDLFLDSGTSKESFGIISQGQIQELINSKPEERRLFIEEAAGVLKYKKRKEESLRKLEKTKDNLDRIKLIIDELEIQVGPLEEQATKATKYLECKTKLKDVEIGLLANDIKEINKEYTRLTEEVKDLNEKIINIDVTSSTSVSKIETIKLKIYKLDEAISNKNNELLKISEEISGINSQKQMTLERKKYEVDDIKLQNNIVSLKEEELHLKKSIDVLENEIKILEDKISNKSTNKNKQIEEYKVIITKKNSKENELRESENKAVILSNKIDIINANIESNAKLPYAVKNVLNNTRLKGIHNTIGSLISMDNTYVTAIETSLGSLINVIVVDNELSAKEAINYLKLNRLGRATFFPINVIKPRWIDESVINELKKDKGFIDVASNLVNYNTIYNNIVLNQLGNVLVVDNIDSLNRIGKSLDYRYKIVSLDGELLNTGGSITGGASKSISGQLSEKQELDNLLKEKEMLQYNINKLKEENISLNDEYTILYNQLNSIENELVVLNETLNIKNKNLNDLRQQHNSKQLELDGTNDTKDKKLDNVLENLLEEFYKKTSYKEVVSQELDELKNQKTELNDELIELEKNNSKTNTEYNKYQNSLKEHEISLGRMDVKLDQLLLTLSEEYTTTYENAIENYPLVMNADEAHKLVNSLKKEIRELGEVNTLSIEDYKRVNKRYTFLKSQQDDLNSSVDNLLNIIDEMDNTMIDKFRETFNAVNNEFNKVFTAMFKGGTGRLSLTDKDNLLETGIEIEAHPPGKTLKSIALLSGGEKALTTLALLFSILNVKPTPFCILDEVEDSLDEANIDTFGKYICNKKNNSQFIIITHKKRTMEYADVLYGITMQESGVSKLVSVKMENI